MPEISVIMDNYNYGQYIGEAIRSVLSQDFSDFELIIVDDGVQKILTESGHE